MSRQLALHLCAAALAIIAPAAHALGLDMGTMWPNVDGMAWTYVQSWEEFDPEPVSGSNVVRLLFDGTTVAPNGIDAQLLRGQLVSGEPAPDALPAAGLLGQLWRARPDLRAALASRIQQAAAGTTAPCPDVAPPGFRAVFLSGNFAFRKTAGEIAAWRCNLADTRSWLWLVADLTLGNQFTLPLVPDITNDVQLIGTIAAFEDVTVPAGPFTTCLRVNYVVDYGTAQCTDKGGTPVGTFRSETRGYVHYAQNVGPIQSFEEFIPYAEATGTCVPPEVVGRVASRVTMRLNEGPVPVTPTTWGRIKAVYRR